jgi:uncharacterized protein (DUF488 family)
MELFTIGHSNHQFEYFQKLLADYQIKVVADVRSSPYSKYVPWANQGVLISLLKQINLDYVFLGKELGGRPSDDCFYTASGKVNYRLLAESSDFQNGIERLKQGTKLYKVAIMCSEEDPEYCHRRLLIAKVLIRQNVEINHIRKTGQSEPEKSLFEEQQPLFENEAWVSKHVLKQLSEGRP